MSKDYRHIGKATQRIDALEIVTGKAKFINDMKLPRMLYGKVLRSPYPHAWIKGLDTKKAERLPGVKAVITYKNAPTWKTGIPPHRLVLDRKVRFVGDGVALVAAKTEAIAEQALDLIDVEYEELPAVYDVDDALKPGAPQLYEEFPGNVFTPGCPVFGPKALDKIVRGDVKKGFEEADFVAEGTYGYENIPNPLPPEPPGVIATWEGPDRLSIWVSSQSASMNRFMMAPSMGFIDIRSISAQCGGSYGSKNTITMPLFYSAALAKATHRPVKVYFTKEEHFDAYGLRVGSRINAKVGMKKDGTVTAIAGEWLVDTGTFSELAQGEIAVGCGEAQVMVSCPNWDLKTKLVATNRNPSGIVRGFGGQELKSALIPLWTLAMEEADLDPVEVFKKNFTKPGDGYFWRDGVWWVCRGVDYSKAMEKGAEVFGWKGKWKGWLKPTSIDGSKRRGVGVGLHGNADAGEDDSEAYVKLNPNGTVVLHCCVSEAGMGERSSVCKMVAEVLNLPLERVTITPPDTLINPFDFGLAGSRGTYAIGSAVIEAAEDAKQKLFELASPMLHKNPEHLETKDGMVYPKGGYGNKLPWIAVMGHARTCTGHGRYEADYSTPNFMMVYTEVEVDMETGKADLVHIVGASDVGQIIDPISLKMQFEGSLGSAGTDTALFEETILDRTTGRILNGNMIDYKWRTYAELPKFQHAILETPFPTHRFKAIGVGEITTAPGPSAVLMAVSNAIGKRIMDYPVTPHKVLKALGKI